VDGRATTLILTCIRYISFSFFLQKTFITELVYKIMKKRLALFTILILFLTSFFPVRAVETFRYDNGKTSLALRCGNILYVGGSGLGNYTTIQTAIDDAADGWIIFVYPGVYKENIIVDKSLRLIGIEDDGVVPSINGSGYNHTIVISADSCVFKGFTVLSNPDFKDLDPNACLLQTNNSIIENNTFLYGQAACHIDGGSRNDIRNNMFLNGHHIGLSTSHGNNNTIAYNMARDNGDGFSCWAETDSIIINNTATNNVQGMRADSCTDCIISHNDIHKNAQYGFTAMLATRLNLLSNTIYSHYYGGMMLTDCSNCTIKENELYDNQWGISLESNWYQYRTKNKNNLVENNLIRDNEMGVMLLTGSRNNVISNNNLISNTKNAWFSLVISLAEPIQPRILGNTWDGNYWGDWSGESPYPVEGYVQIHVQWLVFSINIPWRMYDENPADEPYDWS